MIFIIVGQVTLYFPIRKPRYVFTPGSELKKATSNMSVERMAEIVKECDKPHLE